MDARRCFAAQFVASTIVSDHSRPQTNDDWPIQGAHAECATAVFAVPKEICQLSVFSFQWLLTAGK
jgi:hypothetical protein